MKAYTDLSQSKKLAEILPLESADMVYIASATDDDGETLYTAEYKSEIIIHESDDYINCWSLAALLNLLPSEFIQKGKYTTTTYKIDIRKYKFTDDVDLHQIAYGSVKFDIDGQYSFKDMINTGEKENLIDVVFDMILLLKERNLI